jgi:uncharacterized metal-binding protein
MPSGRVHNAINTMTYLAAAGAYGYAHTQNLLRLEPQQIIVGSMAFFAGTFLLSPDLDLSEQNNSSKRAWGWLGFVWVPYGWVMSHRGMSHTWLVGPLTRLVYLALLLALPAYLLRDQLTTWRIGQAELMAAVIGYYASQWLHLVADGVAPDVVTPVFMQRRRRRR